MSLMDFGVYIAHAFPPRARCFKGSSFVLTIKVQVFLIVERFVPVLPAVMLKKASRPLAGRLWASLRSICHHAKLCSNHGMQISAQTGAKLQGNVSQQRLRQTRGERSINLSFFYFSISKKNPSITL